MSPQPRPVGRPISSGSPEFDQLRSALATDVQLRYELESVLRLSVETYNSSDRGTRFIAGGIVEWALAMAAYSSGILTIPDGHNADGNDLRGVLDQGKALWSVKSSASRGGDFTVSNGQGGSGRGLVVPTIFLSPEFPGLVYVDPALHPALVEAQKAKSDSVKLSKRPVAQHAEDHPECVAEMTIPENPGTATRDPSFEAAKLLVQGGTFPRLRRLLDDAKGATSSVVSQIKELKALLDQGALSKEQFDAAIRKVTQ